MRKYFLFLGFLFFAGCTSVETYHNACIEGFKTIAGQVGCVKANILQDEYLKNDTLAQEYMRTGDFLVKQVAESKMGEEEAQLLFVQKLNEVRREDLREQAYRAQIDRANRDLLPKQTECEERNGKLYCTTY